MKTILKIYFLTSILIFSTGNGFCDTIDYYHVYYNNLKIKEFNQHHLKNPPTIEIDIDSLKNADKIIVKYWNDTPCSNCKFFIRVKDNDTKKIISENSNIGQFKPLTIKLKDLLEYYAIKNKSKLEIYYFENNDKNIRLLFYLTLIN